MTLLDAPQFDAARDRRNRILLYSAAGTIFVLFVAWWLVAGRPVDWPWNWDNYIFGRASANHFLEAIEQNDLAKAYGIWYRDPNWKQHPQQYSSYTFERFQEDWSRTSPDNEYGDIRSHKIAAARMYGNVLLMAILINGRTSNALDLAYDPSTHTLSFPPPGVRLSTKPFSLQP